MKFAAATVVYGLTLDIALGAYTCPSDLSNKPTLDAANDVYCGTTNTYQYTYLVTDTTSTPTCTTYCATCVAGGCNDVYAGESFGCTAGVECTICTEPQGCVMGESDDDDDMCFHVDSKIDYKGFEYTYEELKAGKEAECTVPHSPYSKGVVISTSCDKTVRVTDTHLMATTKGFQLAYSLKAGDVLFGDYNKEMCTVKSVEKENTTQQYFGLNCVHSEVLASGLRASTFGDFHTLPSWYMTYVGGMIGSDTASSLGEYIAEWYFQKK